MSHAPKGSINALSANGVGGVCSSGSSVPTKALLLGRPFNKSTDRIPFEESPT